MGREGDVNLGERIRALSASYGPPVVDLREGLIRDDWGHENNATRPISHAVPEDVSLEDLEFYQDHVFSYLESTDLLFYLWPIWRWFREHANLDALDSFLGALDQRTRALRRTLSKEERLTVSEAVRSLFEAGHDHVDFDWLGTIGRVAKGWEEF